MHISIINLLYRFFSPKIADASQGIFSWLGTTDSTPPPTASDLNVFVIIVKNIATSAVGAVAISMFFWGILKLFLAGGDQSKVTEAKKIIYASLTGISIIIVSRFLIETFLTGTYNYGL
jgi:hypothetical protein